MTRRVQQQIERRIALSDRQQAALVTLGRLMGDPSDDFDRELQEHMDRRHVRLAE
jgi:hypothetical protein